MTMVIQNLTTNNKKARSHPGIEPLNLYQGFIVNITSPGQSLFWPTCNFAEGHALQPHPGNKMGRYTVQSSNYRAGSSTGAGSVHTRRFFAFGELALASRQSPLTLSARKNLLPGILPAPRSLASIA